MPLIQNQKDTNLPQGKFSKFSHKPQYLDRDQLETVFAYGTILFLVIGVAVSVTYMTIQQLKK